MEKKNRDAPIMKKKLTKREAYPIIEKYFKSGMLPYEFYKQEGWSDNQFYLWRKHYMEEHGMFKEAEREVPTFHPIELTPPKVTSSDKAVQEFTIEIIYPNGVILRVYSKNTSQLVDLIKLY